MSVDPSRLAAFRVLRQVSAEGAYANLALNQVLGAAKLTQRDAAFVTELVNGTCRSLGLYDAIIELAAGRSLTSLQPAVVDLLRLGTHQLLDLRVPSHAAVATSVDVGRAAVSPRVTGVINAILRKVAAHDLDGWLKRLQAKASAETGSPLVETGASLVERVETHDPLVEPVETRRVHALALRHPLWIADAYRRVLPSEWEDALRANNVAPHTHAVVRPGLADVSELGGRPTRYSPYGAVIDGDPGRIPAVSQGRAGVQDEGSQLVAQALARADAPPGPWLDLCAGPGGKAALLAGLAAEHHTRFVAAELQPHRARLVAHALAAYPEPRPLVIAADGTRPAWPEARFAKVMVDAPCTGLGSLRRRPESRWRRQPSDVPALVALQKALLRTAIASTVPGGVVAYVTCSPLTEETEDVVRAVLADGTAEVIPAAPLVPEVPDAERGDFVQLWPHRHGTDAMFLALLRVPRR